MTSNYLLYKSHTLTGLYHGVVILQVLNIIQGEDTPKDLFIARPRYYLVRYRAPRMPVSRSNRRYFQMLIIVVVLLASTANTLISSIDSSLDSAQASFTSNPLSTPDYK